MSKRRGVTRLPNGRFEARIKLLGVDRRKRFRLEAEALAWRSRTVASIRERQFRDPSKLMLDRAVPDYLEWSEGALRPATFQLDKWATARLLACSWMANRRMDSVTGQDLERFRRALQDEGLSSRTVDGALERVKRMWSKAVEWGWLSPAQAQSVLAVKLAREANERVRWLTGDEERQLLQGCPHTKLYRFAILTGARQGELVQLARRHVNLEAGVCVLPGAKVKSKQRTRRIYLNVEARAILSGILEGLDDDPDALVFTAAGGGPMVNVKRSWRTWLAQVKKRCKKDDEKFLLQGVHFHDLRHTFASRLVMSGVDINTVRELMGHTDIRLTMRYAHLAPSHLSDAVEKLALVVIPVVASPAKPRPV